MVEVSAKVAVVNLLLHHPNGVTFPMLNEFRRVLLKEAGEPFIFVDTSEDSILSMVECAGVVLLDKDTIKRTPDSDSYYDPAFVDKYINSGYSEGFKKILFEVCLRVS
jgi:hypothetical protein